MQANTSVSCVVVKKDADGNLLYRTNMCRWSPELAEAEVMDEDTAISRTHQLQNRYRSEDIDYRITD